MRNDIWFPLLGICFLLSSMSASHAEDASPVVPGILEAQRTQLLEKIESVRAKGVGVKPYLDAFTQIEASIKEGAAEDTVSAQIDRLRRALADQIGGGTRGTGGPAAPYPASIAFKLLKTWGKRSVTAAGPVISFDVKADGTALNVKLATSSGNASIDREALLLIPKCSPFERTTDGPVKTTVDFRNWSASFAFAKSTASEQTESSLNNDACKLMERAKYKEAIDKLEAALKRAPSYAIGRENLSSAWNNLGLENFKKGDVAAAMSCYHKALDIDSSNRLASENLEESILKLGKNPRSFADRVSVAEQCATKGDCIGARVEYRAALRLKEDSDVRAKLDELARKK